MPVLTLSLFDGPPDLPAGASIQDRFEVFHAQHPWVYTELVRMTRELVEHGHDQVGIGMLFEVLRWEHMRRTRDLASEFKLNNSYRSRFARLIMTTEPDLDGVFETRALKAA